MKTFPRSSRLGASALGLSVVLGSALVLSCGTGSKTQQSQVQKIQLKNMSQEEAQADFAQIVETFRRNYGPLKFKEQRFAFTFDDLVAEHKQRLSAAVTDGEYFEIFASFLASFRDGHVSFRAPVLTALNEVTAEIPIALMPVEGKALVESIIDPSIKDFGIAEGDIILRIDGQDPVEIAKQLSKLKSSGNEESDKHNVVNAFFRRNYMGKLYPKSPTALVEVQKPDGKVFQVTLSWRRTTDLGERKDKLVSYQGGDTQLIASGVSEDINFAGRIKMGSQVPFFATPKVLEKMNFAELTPSASFLKKYGQEKAAPIYAALYKSGGKTILMIRQPGYGAAPGFTIDNHIGTYKAILDQYEELTDVLIVDQTHNPGGSVSYVSEMSNLFATQPMGNFVQAQRADRKWITDYRDASKELKETNEEASLFALNMSKKVEEAYDKGRFLTEPLSFDGRLMLTGGDYVWTKPVLILIDELAGSGGDAFPMLMKAAGRAKLFGKRTMGLGGSVEEEVLANSRATYRVTRGLFTAYKPDGNYLRSDYVENNGVSPDVKWEHNIKDVRGGYVDYVTSFTAEAVKLAE